MPTRKKAVDEEVDDQFDATAEDDDEEEEDTEAGELPTILDLSAVEPASYEVIPKGTYQGYIEDIEYGLSQSKNLPMLTWILKFDYEDKERTLRFYTTLAGEGLPRTVATLTRLDPDLDMSQFEPEAMAEHFAEMEVLIRVTTRRDRDDKTIMRNNVQDILPLDEE